MVFFLTVFDGVLYAVGAVAGWPVLACVVSEKLRALGRFTYADVLCRRLYEQLTCILTSTSTLCICCGYLISQMVAAASANYPLLLLTMYWRGLTTRGAFAGAGAFRIPDVSDDDGRVYDRLGRFGDGCRSPASPPCQVRMNWRTALFTSVSWNDVPAFDRAVDMIRDVVVTAPVTLPYAQYSLSNTLVVQQKSFSA